MVFVELLVGMTLVGIALYDIFETVVVPRRSGRWMRLAPNMIIFLWPLWRRFGVRIHPDWRREDFLGTFAPSFIMLMLVVWVLMLIFGFGVMLHALSDQIQPTLPDFTSAVYLAATSLLTVGFGDFVPVRTLARGVVLLAAASGLAVMAMTISLMFNLYAQFARREVLVLLLDARAGAPPSGVMLLEAFGRTGTIEQLDRTFNVCETWTAEMLDSHLAYAILPFFRSSHDGLSWVSTLGAVLDAATLLMTTLRSDSIDDTPGLRYGVASAEMMYATGCHALVDLTHTRSSQLRVNLRDPRPGIERAEFEAACRQLMAAGYDVVCNDESWLKFAKHRSLYAEQLGSVARYFASPPSQWIGDRSQLRIRHLHPHFET